MPALPQIQPIPSALSDQTLTLSLVIKSPGDVLVRSCEIIGRNCRSRFSFPNHSKLEDLLTERLSQAIQASLQSIPEGAHVLSQPDFLVELPGLVLHGIHVMVKETTDGVRNAILRFKDFMGGVTHAFVEDIGFHQPPANHCEKLAVSVLEDICLPLLNLCHALSECARQNGEPLPMAVTDKARDFQFQTELLKRFIFNSNIGHADAADGYLKAHHQLKPLRLQR